MSTQEETSFWDDLVGVSGASSTTSLNTTTRSGTSSGCSSDDEDWLASEEAQQMLEEHRRNLRQQKKAHIHHRDLREDKEDHGDKRDMGGLTDKQKMKKEMNKVDSNQNWLDWLGGQTQLWRASTFWMCGLGGGKGDLGDKSERVQPEFKCTEDSSGGWPSSPGLPLRNRPGDWERDRILLLKVLSRGRKSEGFRESRAQRAPPTRSNQPSGTHTQVKPPLAYTTSSASMVSFYVLINHFICLCHLT